MMVHLYIKSNVIRNFDFRKISPLSFFSNIKTSSRCISKRDHYMFHNALNTNFLSPFLTLTLSTSVKISEWSNNSRGADETHEQAVDRNWGCSVVIIIAGAPASSIGTGFRISGRRGIVVTIVIIVIRDGHDSVEHVQEAVVGTDI